MGGHMGDVRVTSKNHALVSVDVEKNLLVVKGSVPGPTGGYVIVKQSKGGK
jgi:large subunit ribosomal protein L3